MTGPDKIRTRGGQARRQHGMKEIGPTLRDLVADKKHRAAHAIASLQALETLKDGKLAVIAQVALDDADPRLRHQGRRILLQTASKAEAVRALAEVLDMGEVVERQGALALLADDANRLTPTHCSRPGSIGSSPRRRRRKFISISSWLSRATRPPRSTKNSPPMRQRATEQEPVAVYREALLGGDAEAGRKSSSKNPRSPACAVTRSTASAARSAPT